MKKLDFAIVFVFFILSHFCFGETNLLKNKIQNDINLDSPDELFLYNCEEISKKDGNVVYFITAGFLDDSFYKKREIEKIGIIKMSYDKCVKKTLVDFSSIFREDFKNLFPWEKRLCDTCKHFSMGWIVNFRKISGPIIIIEKLSGMSVSLYFYTVRNDELFLLYKLKDQFSSIAEINEKTGQIFLNENKTDFLFWNNKTSRLERRVLGDDSL